MPVNPQLSQHKMEKEVLGTGRQKHEQNLIRSFVFQSMLIQCESLAGLTTFCMYNHIYPQSLMLKSWLLPLWLLDCITSHASLLYYSKMLVIKDFLLRAKREPKFRIRPAPAYLSADKRIRGINTHPSDDPNKQQPIYDLMSLYNTNPISSSTQSQSEQQGGGSSHIDNR